MNPRDQQMKPGAPFNAGCKEKQELGRNAALSCPRGLLSQMSVGDKVPAYQQKRLWGLSEQPAG